jgi:hypothetical protein
MRKKRSVHVQGMPSLVADETPLANYLYISIELEL